MAEETPAVEEEPAAEETPVAEETPAAEEAPAAELNIIGEKPANAALAAFAAAALRMAEESSQGAKIGRAGETAFEEQDDQEAEAVSESEEIEAAEKAAEVSEEAAEEAADEEAKEAAEEATEETEDEIVFVDYEESEEDDASDEAEVAQEEYEDEKEFSEEDFEEDFEEDDEPEEEDIQKAKEDAVLNMGRSGFGFSSHGKKKSGKKADRKKQEKKKEQKHQAAVEENEMIPDEIPAEAGVSSEELAFVNMMYGEEAAEKPIESRPEPAEESTVQEDSNAEAKQEAQAADSELEEQLKEALRDFDDSPSEAEGTSEKVSDNLDQWFEEDEMLTDPERISRSGQNAKKEKTSKGIRIPGFMRKKKPQEPETDESIYVEDEAEKPDLDGITADNFPEEGTEPYGDTPVKVQPDAEPKDEADIAGSKIEKGGKRFKKLDIIKKPEKAPAAEEKESGTAAENTENTENTEKD